MQKTIKKLLAVALAVTLCVTMLPAQAVQAETTVTNVDETNLTDEQLMEAYFGDWDNCCTISKEKFETNYYYELFDETRYINENWIFVGSEIVEGIPMSDMDYERLWIGDGQVEGKAKILKFETDEYDFRVRKGYDIEWGNPCLFVERQEKGDAEAVSTFKFFNKFAGITEYNGEPDILTMGVLELLQEVKAKYGFIDSEDSESEIEPEEKTAYIADEFGTVVDSWATTPNTQKNFCFVGLDDFSEDKYSYTWLSNAPEVAKVNQQGKCEAVEAGSALITVAIVNNYTGETVRITPIEIIVSDNAPEPTATPTPEPTATPTPEPTATPMPEPTVTGEEYTVKLGDTLCSIAKANDLTLKELVSANEIANIDFIVAGSKLVIPDIDTTKRHIVGKGDTLYRIAKANGCTVADLVKINKIKNANLIYIGQLIKLP